MSVFIANRVERRFTQNLVATPEVLIPLLAPRAEEKWAQDWHPRFVFENPGLPEQGSIFLTRHGSIEEVWLMTNHDLAAYRSDFVRFTADYICEIEIQLRPEGQGHTQARLMYRYTALTEQGNLHIRHHFTKKEFELMATTWERELNAYVVNAHLDGLCD